MLVSLEQAYALLLNNQHDDKSLEKYFIYSNLSKAGYNVQPHRKHLEPNQGICNAIQLCWSREVSPADKCVWRCLFEDLKQSTSSKDISQGDNELYLKVKQNMKNIEEAIKSQRPLEVNDSGLNDRPDSWQSAIVKVKARKESSRKRKTDSNSLPSTSKKLSKLESTTGRFLDVLTYEQDVCNFRRIFEEIQVIQLEPPNFDNIEDSTTSELEFDFDLYLARPSFKQSDPGPPNFRILIFKSKNEPPKRELIVKTFLKPVVRVPVLVFYINELMRVSAFLYRISL